jgi:hypothetical protein
MDTLFAYLIKSIISSGVLTAYYWFALRNKKFHYYNRFYLLSVLPISLIVPFLNFRWFSLNQPDRPYINTLLSAISPPAEVHGAAAAGFSYGLLFSGIGILVSASLLIILIFRICRLYYLKRIHPHTRMNGFDLIETELGQAPFSFLDNLFWKSSISLDSEDGEKIFRHELTHIRQKHTYDKLFSQAVVCLFWMNPFYWLIQKELNMIHEFIADETSVKEGDAGSLARMLLQAHNAGAYLDPSHSFFYSPIKRRLIMITQSKKTSHSYLRRVLALPVVLLAVSLFSFTVLRAQSSSDTKQDTTGNAKRYDEKVDAEKIARDQHDRENGRLMNSKLKIALQSLSQGPEGNKLDAKKLMEAILKDPPDIIYYVNGVVRSPEYVKGLKEEEVATVNLLTGDMAAKKFGENGRHGVIEFTTKK